MPVRGQYNESGQSGDLNQWDAKWKGAVAVVPGDLVFRDADGYDKPVANYTFTTNIATTAGTLNALFRGVSMARRVTTQTLDGDKADGNILYDGEFCFDCAALASAAAPGDLVSFAESPTNFVANQLVRITAAAGEAIGRVTRDSAVGATSIWFKLLTPRLYGGPTAAA